MRVGLPAPPSGRPSCGPRSRPRSSKILVLLAGALLTGPITLSAQTADQLYNQATLAIQQGRFHDAAAILEQAVQLLPGNAGPLVGLGYVYTRLDRLDEALVILDWAVTLAPNNAEAHLNMGFLQWQRGDRERAVLEYGTATRLDPSNAMAHYNLGNSYLTMGSPADAVAPLEQALQLQPDYLDALITLGAARVNMGDAAGALAPLRRAASLAPNRADARYNLGLALGRSNDMAGAGGEYAWLEANAPELASLLHQELGDRVVQARAHTALPQPQAAPQAETDPSITLLGRSAGEGVADWNVPGAEDAILGSWRGAFKLNGGSVPLGEATLTVSGTDSGEYLVQVSSGWVKMHFDDDAPYFQQGWIRFVEKRDAAGTFPIFEYEGDSGAAFRGRPMPMRFYLRPYYDEVRLVAYIGNAMPTDLSGLVRVSRDQ